LYLYWRSSLTESSKILPDFPDQRAAGIDLMKKVEREGIYLGFGASLALAYSYLDQKENRLALDRSLYIRARYPDNVVNNMTLARIYTIYQRFEDALRLYEEVLVDDPDNQRSWYHKGVVLTRLGRFSEAQSALDHYLGFAEIPVDARAQAWYRIGLLKARQGATDAARTAFEESIRIHNNPSARRALARLNAGKLFAPAEEEAP
jgi:tetratricopeptide (TPR) repeat protein